MLYDRVCFDNTFFIQKLLSGFFQCFLSETRELFNPGLLRNMLSCYLQHKISHPMFRFRPKDNGRLVCHNVCQTSPVLRPSKSF